MMQDIPVEELRVGDIFILPPGVYPFYASAVTVGIATSRPILIYQRGTANVTAAEFEAVALSIFFEGLPHPVLRSRAYILCQSQVRVYRK